jgi:hypothetical protein
MQRESRLWTAARAGCIASILCAGGCLSGCSSFNIFADPGKYEFSSCEHLDGQRKNWSKKEEELRLLMNKAEQSASGTVVSVIAYKADHVAATEELKLVENAARSKNCNSPENWQSNSVVR